MSSAIDPAVLQAALDRFSALQSHDNQSLRPSTPLFSSTHDDDGDDDHDRQHHHHHYHHHRPAKAASPVTPSVDEQRPQTHLLQAINLLAAAAMSDEPCGGPSPDGLRRLAIDAVQRYLDDGQVEESTSERCLEGVRRCLRLLPALAAGGISASIGGALVGRAVAIDITNALHNIITVASRRQAGSTTATSSGPAMLPAFPTSAAMTVAAVNVMREWLPLVDRLFRVFASLSWCEPDHSDDSALLPQQSHEDDDTVRDGRGLPSSTANPLPTLSPTLDVRPDATGDELPPRFGNAGNGCCAHPGGGSSTWAATVRGMLTPLVSLAGACAVGRERCDDRDGAGPWHARFAVTALSQALAVVADASPNGDHRALGTAAAEAVTAACPDAEIERIAAAVDVATASMLAVALQRALLPE